MHGEQFCYFHQNAHRGVRRPPHSRLHPIALIESEEAIQASLMEVINALLRNSIDLKRATLILRALHIAVKNARRVNLRGFGDSVRDIPQYADAPAHVPAVDLGPPAAGVAAAVVETKEPELDIPYTAAIPLEPSREEQAEQRRAATAEAERARQAAIRASLERAAQSLTNRPATPPGYVVAAGHAAPATSVADRKPPAGVKEAPTRKESRIKRHT